MYVENVDQIQAELQRPDIHHGNKDIPWVSFV